MKDNYNECSIEAGSVTQAMKIQELLSAAAIPSKVIKSQTSSRRGCIYGVSYSCIQESNVRTVLSGASGTSGRHKRGRRP